MLPFIPYSTSAENRLEENPFQDHVFKRSEQVFDVALAGDFQGYSADERVELAASVVVSWATASRHALSLHLSVYRDAKDQTPFQKALVKAMQQQVDAFQNVIDAYAEMGDATQ